LVLRAGAAPAEQPSDCVLGWGCVTKLRGAAAATSPQLQE